MLYTGAMGLSLMTQQAGKGPVTGPEVLVSNIGELCLLQALSVPRGGISDVVPSAGP